MIERTLSERVLQNAMWFPVVSVTGPRQSGKSTLVRTLFPEYEYYNLEDARIYALAAESPADFVFERGSRIVIDEAQRLPELFNAIQVASDERGEVGQYVLSGSQSFALSHHISQSLAGRVGILNLLPLSYGEALQSCDLTPDDFMLRGGYPRMYDVGIPPDVFFQNYLATYVERDVVGLINPNSAAAFRKLLGLCAQAAGNLLNESRLATDVGVNRATVSSWLSILEGSYVIFRLQPYSANIRKRLTKTPKLYFHDTGLLCYLLGIHTPKQLRDSSHRGAIFENLVISETYKRHVNQGQEPRLFFYRDDSKIEVDLVDTTEGGVNLIEIKATQAFNNKYVRSLRSVGDALGVPSASRFVVMRSPVSQDVGSAKVVSARDWLLR